MEQSKEIPLPEAGELIVGTAVRIVPYGAYVTLDEYNNIEGFMHISEISSSWIKNIRDHVREGQKTVLKVLRVDSEKSHIDLSLRRVNEKERKEKLLEWKHEIRGRKLLDMVAEKMTTNPQEAYEKVGVILEDYFGSMYSAFEKASDQGVTLLIKAKIPQDWSTAIVEMAKAKVRVPRMKTKGILELVCAKPNGVNIIKEAFAKALDIKKSEKADIKIYVVGAPKYRIEVLGGTYKEAEKLLENAVQITLKTIEAGGGEGKFKR